MPYLLYNGIEITIDGSNRVCVTDIYNAADKPKNKAPTNFKNSKDGQQKIKEFEGRQGSYVWESRTGRDTQAIVPLACLYLKYLGDDKAADALWQVYETGQSLKYKSPTTSTSSAGFSNNQDSSSIPWGGYIIIIIIALGILGQCSRYQEPQQLPPSPPPQNRFR